MVTLLEEVLATV